MSTKEKKNSVVEKETEDKKAKKSAKKQAKADKKAAKKQAKADKKVAKKAKKSGNAEETVAIVAEEKKEKGAFFKKLKEKLYIENPKLRVLAIVLAVVIFAGGVAGGVIAGIQHKKQSEWLDKTYTQIEEISDKFNALLVMYGEKPINETPLEAIQRKLDTIIKLLGGDVKYSNASSVEAVEEQIAELEEVISEEMTEAASQSSESTTSSNKTPTDTKSTTAKKSTVPSTKAEIVSYCNTALNKVKSQKAGFTKDYIMTVKGDAAGLPDWLTALAEETEHVEIKKGQDSTNDFPASGYTWSSILTEKDVKDATISVSGSVYKIKITLPNEDNPTKGDTSHHGRCMSVMVGDEVKAKASVIKSVNMHYHDAYIYAEIDSKTGNLIKSELSASADLDLSISLIGDVKVTNIVSTETFTNFVW